MGRRMKGWPSKLTEMPQEKPERDIFDFKEVAIEFFEYFYGQVFKNVAVTDYLNPQEVFASTDEKWEVTYSDCASTFFYGIHDLKKVSERGLDQIRDYATFPLFCFQLAVQPIKKIPASSDPAFNQFLSAFINFFHDQYHCLGLPNKEEEALLAVLIFLMMVPDDPDDRVQTAKVKKYFDKILPWYCYHPQHSGSKIMTYAWFLEHLTWEALNFLWEHKQENGLHSLTVQCLFYSPKTQAQRTAVQNVNQ